MVAQLTGCAPAAEQLAEGAAAGAAEPATQETLEALDEPENRERLNSLMTLPGIADAGELASRGVARGMYTFLEEDMTPEEIEALAQRYSEAVGGALGQAIEEHIAPELQSAVSQTFGAVLTEAFTAQTGQRLEQFAVRVTRAVITTAVQALSDSLPDQLGPAVRALISDYIGPGVAEAMREHIGPAMSDAIDQEEVNDFLAQSAHTIGRNTVLGIEQGARDVQQRSTEGAGPFEGLNRALSQGEDTLQTVLWMLGVAVLILLLLVLALGIGLWRIMARSRELIEENKVREQALTDMAHAVQSAEEAHKGEDAALLDRVMSEIEEREGGDYLRDVLERAGWRPPKEKR